MRHYTLNEKILFSTVTVVLCGFTYGALTYKKSPGKSPKGETSQVNYEMAKIKHAESLYSLENRGMDHHLEGFEKEKTRVAKGAPQKQVVVKAQKAQTTQKAHAAQKAAQTALAQKQAQAFRSTQAQANKPPVQFASPETQNDVAQAKRPPVTMVVAPYAQPVTDTIPSAAEGAAPEKTQKTYAQWKAEIFAAQNKETVQKLIVAFKKGEVAMDMVGKLVDEMTATNDEKMIGLALFALRGMPSLQSYGKLIKYENSVNAAYRTYIHETLMSYHKDGLSILKQAIMSPEKAIALRTLEVLKAGVTNLKSGSTSGMVFSRELRSADPAQFSLTNYEAFIPLLKSLAEGSADSEIIALAGQNLDLIDDPRFIAAN